MDIFSPPLYDLAAQHEAVITKYGITHLILAYDEGENGAAEKCRQIVALLKRRFSASASPRFAVMSIGALANVEWPEGNALYVCPPEEGELPSSVFTVNKYWIDVTGNFSASPWPRGISSANAQEFFSKPPAWTKFFNLASLDKENELAAVRTTLRNGGVRGISQYVLLQGGDGLRQVIHRTEHARPSPGQIQRS